MNGVAYQFTAAPVSGEAGMYTADLDGVRASWVVREDGSAIGVQFNGGQSSTRPTCSNSTTRSSAPRCATSGNFSRPSRSPGWPTAG